MMSSRLSGRPSPLGARRPEAARERRVRIGTDSASAVTDRLARDALWCVHLVTEGDAPWHDMGLGAAEPMHHMRVADPCDRMDESAAMCRAGRRLVATNTQLRGFIKRAYRFHSRRTDNRVAELPPPAAAHSTATRAKVPWVSGAAFSRNLEMLIEQMYRWYWGRPAVEVWFCIIGRQAIYRGILTSVCERIAAIRRFIVTWD